MRIQYDDPVYHGRCLLVTEIPQTQDYPMLTELRIVVDYVKPGGGEQAVPLDNAVIPALLAAFDGSLKAGRYRAEELVGRDLSGRQALLSRFEHCTSAVTLIEAYSFEWTSQGQPSGRQGVCLQSRDRNHITAHFLDAEEYIDILEAI